MPIISKARKITDMLFLGQNSLTENNRNKPQVSSWAKGKACLLNLEVQEGSIWLPEH